MVCTDKKYIIFAGVNGVGKSTLYYLHPELQSVARINMDEIASKLGSWKDLSVVMKAGKEAIRLKEQYLREGSPFNQETTLCGRDIINTIRRAKETGYFIEMHYVGVSSVNICKERIRKRVADGGHGVSDDVVERRYRTSFENLKVVMPMCNKIFFYDNTQKMVLFCIEDNGKLKFLKDSIPEWFVKYVMT